jgi:type VI secretion system protein ImpK
VVQILKQGIDNAGRLESSGAGSSQPIALPADLPANRARNRRVEILYSPED